MTTSERIEEQSLCYDPDFPPDVAEGHPLAEAKTAAQKTAAQKTAGGPPASPFRRALRAAGARLSRRERA